MKYNDPVDNGTFWAWVVSNVITLTMGVIMGILIRGAM